MFAWDFPSSLSVLLIFSIFVTDPSIVHIPFRKGVHNVQRVCWLYLNEIRQRPRPGKPSFRGQSSESLKCKVHISTSLWTCSSNVSAPTFVARDILRISHQQIPTIQTGPCQFLPLQLIGQGES